MTELSVNLNAVAQLRNRRNLPWPSVTGIARIALDAGAVGITVHPRPDERHIKRSDVFDLVNLVRTQYPQAELNIEGYPSEAFIDLVMAANPAQVTLVPDAPEQATSDHGWDFAREKNFLAGIVAQIKTSERRVALFCDPDASVQDLALAKATGADRIELYTGPYGACFDNLEAGIAALSDLAETARVAHKIGFEINAGHDLTLANLPAFQDSVPGISEVSIGHGLTADALLYGFAETVRKYRAVLGGA